MKSTREGMKKILHLKGLKRKIPNKWRVNWPAHISFIRHAFKIQQREFTSGDLKKKALASLLFAFLIWLDGFAVNIQLDVEKKIENGWDADFKSLQIMSECIRKQVWDFSKLDKWQITEVKNISKSLILQS